MTDASPSDLPETGDAAPQTGMDLVRANPSDNPFKLDPANPNLDGGQVLYHLAFGAKPEDFHPNVQHIAQHYALAFQPQPKLPGLLGTADQIRAMAAPDAAGDIGGDGPDVPSQTAPHLDLDTTAPDLHIPPAPSRTGPLGLQIVDGLPLDPGHGAVPRFDGLIADKVTSVFQDLHNQGNPAKLRDGFRTRAMQVQAHQKYNGATPGKGLHEAGLAFDVNWEKLTAAQQRAVVDAAKQHGFQWGGAFKDNYDPRHFFVDPFNNVADRQKYIQQLQQTQGR